jgi:hypothetical protein
MLFLKLFLHQFSYKFFNVLNVINSAFSIFSSFLTGCFDFFLQNLNTNDNNNNDRNNNNNNDNMNTNDNTGRDLKQDNNNNNNNNNDKAEKMWQFEALSRGLSNKAKSYFSNSYKTK